MKFYEPTATMISHLSGDWCASFSGGKDSTSLVTWIEWLRRTKQIECAKPKLVQVDTGVEEPYLQEIAAELCATLTASGWECALVTPAVRERLYNRILGVGLPPIHPGVRRMRWCTRSTKIDPMRRFDVGGLLLTGLRLGESKIRDGKLAASGCVAGGECGIPAASSNTYSPIIQWRTCQVIDWLNGAIEKQGRNAIADILPTTRKLVDIYNVTIGQAGLWDDIERDVSAARFGCIGCPAIAADRSAPKATVKRNTGRLAALNEIYDVWFVARLASNRLVNAKTGGLGPIRMEVRPVLFERIMDIQKRAGVTIVTEEDEAFIRQCWRDKVYPRGWSESDELNCVAYELF